MKTDRPKEKVELPLASDDEVAEVVAGFEACTLPHKHWTHRAHLAVAVTYLRAMPFDEALNHLRERINAYNRTCGDPTGYNETVTRLFLGKIRHEAITGNAENETHAEVARLAHLCDVSWLYRHYSKARIWSDEAKQGWIEPDVCDLNFRND